MAILKKFFCFNVRTGTIIISVFSFCSIIGVPHAVASAIRLRKELVSKQDLEPDTDVSAMYRSYCAHVVTSAVLCGFASSGFMMFCGAVFRCRYLLLPWLVLQLAISMAQLVMLGLMGMNETILAWILLLCLDVYTTLCAFSLYQKLRGDKIVNYSETYYKYNRICSLLAAMLGLGAAIATVSYLSQKILLHEVDMTKRITEYGIACSIIYALSCMFMAWGILKKKSYALLPWLVLQVKGIVAMLVFLGIYLRFSRQQPGVFVQYDVSVVAPVCITVVMISSLFWIITQKLYSDFKTGKQ